MQGIYLSEGEKCLGYTVCHFEGTDPVDLYEEKMDDEIKSLLTDGWILVGGVSTFIWIEDGVRIYSFSQALVYIVDDD